MVEGWWGRCMCCCSVCFVVHHLQSGFRSTFLVSLLQFHSIISYVFVFDVCVVFFIKLIKVADN